MTTRQPDERGQVGGVESIPFGVLVFIVGTLIAVNGWAWLSTHRAADSIAREYLRTYTEQHSETEARAAASDVAGIIIESRSISPDRVTINAPTTHEPCELAEVTVAIAIPAMRLPFITNLGARTVAVTHVERMDPYRSRTDAPDVRGPTPCG